MSGRVLAIARRLMEQLLADRRAVALVLGMPVVIMTLLAAVLSNPEKIPKVAVRASGTTELFVRDIEQRLGDVEDPDSRVEVVVLPDEVETPDAIRRGLADAVLQFPPDFLEQRVSGKRGQVDLHLDGADPMRSAQIGKRLQESVGEAITGLPKMLPADCPGHCGDTIPDAAPELELRRLHGDHIDDDVDFFTPVLPPFFVFFFVFLLSGLAFLRERVDGTAERILASPLGRGELVLGYVLGFLPAALVQGLVTVLFARYALGGPWGGWPVVAAILLLALAAECFGVFVSAFARSEFQVIQFVPMFILPQLLLSGIFWPVSELPGWLRPLSVALPLTHAVDAVRDAAVRQLPGVETLDSLGILLGFTALAIVLAAFSIRRTAT